MSYADFLSHYNDSRYIVLVGKPDSEIVGVESLVYELLQDTGEVLTSMSVPGAHEMVVRYGIWEDTQTVVMFSRAISYDVYSVLSIMRGSNVTIFTDGIQIDYNVAHSEHYMLGLTTLSLGSIDIVKHVDATLSITLSSQQVPSIVIMKYDTSTTPHALNTPSGLIAGEEALGRYLDVSLTIDGESVTSVEEALIIICYRHSDLDRNDNGIFNDTADIKEETLCLYMFETSSNAWIRISDDLEWVMASGVNATDITIYGEEYAGYVWARITHLSLFGVAGQPYSIAFPLTAIVVLGVVSGVFAIGLVVIFLKRRGRIVAE